MKEPILIKMRGELGEVKITIPCHVIDYNVAAEGYQRGLAAINLAVTLYKAMEKK